MNRFTRVFLFLTYLAYLMRIFMTSNVCCATDKIVALVEEMRWVDWLIAAISLTRRPIAHILDVLPLSTDPGLINWCCVQLSIAIHELLVSEPNASVGLLGGHPKNSHQLDLAHALTLLDDALLRLWSCIDSDLWEVLSGGLYPALESYISGFLRVSQDSPQAIFNASCRVRGRLDLALRTRAVEERVPPKTSSYKTKRGTLKEEKSQLETLPQSSLRNQASLAWAAVLEADDVSQQLDDSELDDKTAVGIAAYAVVAALFGDIQEVAIPEDPDPVSPAKVLLALLAIMPEKESFESKPNCRNVWHPMHITNAHSTLLPYLLWHLALRIHLPTQQRFIVEHHGSVIQEHISCMVCEKGLGFELWVTKQLRLVGNVMRTVTMDSNVTTVSTTRSIDPDSSRILFAAALLVPHQLIVMLLDKASEEDDTLEEALCSFLKNVPGLLSYSVHSIPVVCSYVRDALAGDVDKVERCVKVAIDAERSLARSILSFSIIPALKDAQIGGHDVGKAMKVARRIVEQEPGSLDELLSAAMLDIVLPTLRPEGRVRRADLDGWVFSMPSSTLEEGLFVCKACLRGVSPEMRNKVHAWLCPPTRSSSMFLAKTQRCRTVWERADVLCSILDGWVIGAYLDLDAFPNTGPHRAYGWLTGVWTPAGATDALVVAAALLLPCLTDAEVDRVLVGLEFLVSLMSLRSSTATASAEGGLGPPVKSEMEQVFTIICRGLKALASVPDLVTIAGAQGEGNEASPLDSSLDSPSPQRRVAVARMSRCLGRAYNKFISLLEENSKEVGEKQFLILRLQASHRAFLSVKECLAVVNRFRYDDTQVRICCLSIASDLKRWSRLV
jgi:hypothetical protein